MSIQQFYQKIIPLNYIVRYSNVPRIKDETVAAHSFLVSAIVIKLADYYKFDIGKAVIMAVCHDMPEYDVNDTTHATKQKYPKIAKALQEAEFYALSSMPIIVQEAWTEFETGETVEAKIVKLADVLQCSQYAENECLLGNFGYMRQVVNNSNNRAKELFKELESYQHGDNYNHGDR